MKALFVKSLSIQLLLTITLFWSFFALLFVSCQKETLYVEVPGEIQVDTCHHTIEIPDLIAFFNPLAHVLYATDGYDEIALDQLNAVPRSDGGYVGQIVNSFGEPVELEFHVEIIELPDLENVANSIDTMIPELVKEFKEKGTLYRFFKNAKCGGTIKGFTSACKKNDDGTSSVSVYYDAKRCERGNEFCTEAFTVWGREITYLNDNCEGLIKDEQPLFYWQCQ